MIKIIFQNYREMYYCLVNCGVDLYNIETCSYVFCYNELGSIAEYMIDNDEARHLALQTLASTSGYWGAHLGRGGYVYDSIDAKSEHLGYPTDDGEPLENDAFSYCQANFNKGTWVKANESYLLKDIEYTDAYPV